MSGANIGFGAFAGVVGGAVFILMMGMMSDLPPLGELIGQPTALASLFLHVLSSILLGGLFAALLGRWAVGTGRGLRYGLLYGTAWWIAGPLTLVPLLLGEGPFSRWDPAGVVPLLPSLLGFSASGAVLGATYGWLWATAAEDRAAAAEPPRAPSPRGGDEGRESGPPAPKDFRPSAPPT